MFATSTKMPAFFDRKQHISKRTRFCFTLLLKLSKSQILYNGSNKQFSAYNYISFKKTRRKINKERVLGWTIKLVIIIHKVILNNNTNGLIKQSFPLVWWFAPCFTAHLSYYYLVMTSITLFYVRCFIYEYENH